MFETKQLIAIFPLIFKSSSVSKYLYPKTSDVNKAISIKAKIKAKALIPKAKVKGKCLQEQDKSPPV